MGEHFNRNNAVYVSGPREPIVEVESVRRWRGSKIDENAVHCGLRRCMNPMRYGGRLRSTVAIMRRPACEAITVSIEDVSIAIRIKL